MDPDIITSGIYEVVFKYSITLLNRQKYHARENVMSVLLETSAGDIVIDLLVDYAPKLCEKYVPNPHLLVNR